MSERKPVIGITTDLKEGHFAIEDKYAHAVIKAGGIPVLIPSVTGNDVLIVETMNTLDGLLLPGSRDMDPKFYGEDPNPKIRPMSIERTETEFSVLREAIENEKPVLGICGGMQLLNVFFGGSLYQDIYEYVPEAIAHEKGAEHEIDVTDGSILHRITDSLSFAVKSYHHQSVNRVGGGLIVNAVTKDGIVEGIESENGAYVLGVQWHPELEDTEISRSIFEEFISAAAKK